MVTSNAPSISEMRTAMHFDTIVEIGNKIRMGVITASALTEMILDRIEDQNANLNAYITVTVELAREQARQADSELRRGYDRGPLHGIPTSFSTRRMMARYCLFYISMAPKSPTPRCSPALVTMNSRTSLSATVTSPTSSRVRIQWRCTRRWPPLSI